MSQRTIETLEAQFKAAPDANCAATIRMRARDFASAQNIPVPAWAAIRNVGRPQVHARRAPVTSTAISAAIPSYLCAEIKAWRARTPGSVVQINAAGVTLHTIGAEPRTYPTMAEAVEAVSNL